MITKIRTFLIVVFLFALSLYQDTIGQTIFHFAGRSDISYQASLFLGRSIVFAFFLLLLGSYKKIKFREFISTMNLKMVMLFLILPVAVLKILPLLGLYLMFTILLHKSASLSFHEPWLNFIFISINTIILGPIIEEILFRAVLFDRLRKFIPVAFAVVLSSLVFSLFHSEDSQIIITFILGIIFAVIYRRTQNLAYPIVLHAALNAMTVFSKLLSF